MSTAQLVIGLYGTHLDQIAKIQSDLPEQVLYLQPYSPNKMGIFTKRKEQWPEYFLFSTTDQVNEISYVSKVHGWEDKVTLYEHHKERWDRISQVIVSFMLNEFKDGLYRYAHDPEKLCRNLLSVSQMKRLPTPIPITELIKVNDSKPHGERSTSGGWSEISLSEVQLAYIQSLP